MSSTGPSEVIAIDVAQLFVGAGFFAFALGLVIGYVIVGAAAVANRARALRRPVDLEEASR